MSGTVGKNIAAESARDWVRGSLVRGTVLARLVSRRLSGLTQAVLLAPPSLVPEAEPTLNDVGRLPEGPGHDWRAPDGKVYRIVPVPTSESDAVARSLFARLGGTSLLTLVVEDDMGRRGDPHVGRAAFIADPDRYWKQRQAAFIGDRVLYWEQLDARGERAVRLLRRGAHGYPRNAYLLKGSPSDNGLASDKELSARDLEHISVSTRGVIVSVWDNESFIALLAPEFRL